MADLGPIGALDEQEDLTLYYIGDALGPYISKAFTDADEFQSCITNGGDENGPFIIRSYADDISFIPSTRKPLILAPDGKVGEIFAPGTIIYI